MLAQRVPSHAQCHPPAASLHACYNVSPVLTHSPVCALLQVLFARVNSPMLAQRVPSVLKALKYSEWALAVASEAVGLSDNFTQRVSGKWQHAVQRLPAAASKPDLDQV